MKTYCQTKSESEKIEKSNGIAKHILANLQQCKIDPVKRHNDTVNLLNERAELRRLQAIESAARNQNVEVEFNTDEMLDNHRKNWNRLDK